MFGFMKKLQGSFAELANTSIKSENKDLMEAMVASAVLVAYADGELSGEELDKTRKILESTSQLAVFGQEPMKIFDKYCDKMEASKRQGKFDLLKEVSEVQSGSEDAARVLIMAIEVADSEGGIGNEEMEMLKLIAGKIGLKLENFL